MLEPNEKLKVSIESNGAYEVDVNAGPYRKIGTALSVVILLEVAALFYILFML